MPLHEEEAYVLTSYKLAEADRIVVFFTAHSGVKRGVAKGARRLRSRFGGALECLSKGVVSYFEREGRELVSINAVDILASPMPLLASAEAPFYLAYFAEHVLTLALERDPLEHLYRLLDTSLEALRAGADFARVRVYFEVWALRLAGVFPDVAACAACGEPLQTMSGAVRFRPDTPGFVHEECGGGIEMASAAWRLLLAILKTHPAGLSRLDTPAAALAALSDTCKMLRRDFLGKELKSYALLESMQ